MPRLTRRAPKKAKKARMRAMMHKYKHGRQYSSSGHKVTSRAQAIAIGLSESGQSRKVGRKRAHKRGHKLGYDK